MVVCSLDPSPLPLRYRVDGDLAEYCGDYQKRARRPLSDVDVCFVNVDNVSAPIANFMSDPFVFPPDTS